MWVWPNQQRPGRFVRDFVVPLLPVSANQLKWAMKELTLEQCVILERIAMRPLPAFQEEVLLSPGYDLQKSEIHFNQVVIYGTRAEYRDVIYDSDEKAKVISYTVLTV